MARMIVRDMFFTVLIGIFIMMGMFYFIFGFAAQYNMDVPSQYGTFYSEINDSANELKLHSDNLVNITEGGEGIVESSTGDEFTIAGSLVSALRLIYKTPSMVLTFISMTTRELVIPDFVSTIGMAIVSILVVMLFISVIARKDS